MSHTVAFITIEQITTNHKVERKNKSLYYLERLRDFITNLPIKSTKFDQYEKKNGKLWQIRY